MVRSINKLELKKSLKDIQPKNANNLKICAHIKITKSFKYTL